MYLGNLLLLNLVPVVLEPKGEDASVVSKRSLGINLIFPQHQNQNSLLVTISHHAEAMYILVFSSPEPKAHGELIVYQSSRRPSVRLCVRASTLLNINISETSGPIATKFYLIGVGERLHQVFGQIGLELWFPWQPIAPIGL